MSFICLHNLQATIRQPVVKNMMKALYFQFTVGVLPLYLVAFTGYWAYGSSTEVYLLNSVNGAVWVKASANITAFLQSVIALHVHTYTFKLEFSLLLNVLLELFPWLNINNNNSGSVSTRFLQVQCTSFWILNMGSKEVH